MRGARPGLRVLLLALCERLAEVGVRAQVQRGLALLVLHGQVGAVGGKEAGRTERERNKVKQQADRAGEKLGVGEWSETHNKMAKFALQASMLT